MTLVQKIHEHVSNPHQLELLYRDDPEDFTRSLSEALKENPDSQVLVVWNERLNYLAPDASPKATLLNKNFALMGLLSILAGVCTRLAFYFLNNQSILPINIIFGLVPFLAILFLLQNPPKRTIILIVFACIITALVFVNTLSRSGSDSIILSQLHFPIFLWLLLGLAFTGNEYPKNATRLSFLRFTGDFVVIYGVMAAGGIVLTGLTISLFTMVDLTIVDIYMENVVVFGAAALAVVAAYLVVNNLALPKNIVPIIAAIFSPLILITLMVYLITIVLVGKNPFSDRDFLLIFNGVLLVVLAVTIFSITEREKPQGRSISDSINFALLVLAFVIDTVALSAILFRLSAYGLTPNRLAVLGVNIVVWVHLLWVISTYIRFLRGKANLDLIQNCITSYLPVYGIWAAFVAFTFPLFFP